MLSVSDIVKLLDQVPLWRNLKALPQKQAELEARVAALEAAIARRPPIEACPLCGGEMKVTSVRDHPTFGRFGVKEHTLACTACQHRETRKVDPNKR